MELTMVSHYINAFGYITIFLILFCGIVGIPAPEESFLIILGMFIAKVPAVVVFINNLCLPRCYRWYAGSLCAG
ncbi:hypothetical protein OC195_12815 [Priestia flexa]|nr:hypothetical protein OC195_12815 [Priestia flexa]